ncbi:MAG: HEAT repeat domain-containing protein [Planctomycetota bacterium]
MKRFLLALVLLPGCANPSSPRTHDPHIDIRSPDPVVRMQAMMAIAEARDYGSIPRLIESLRDPDQWVRHMAHTALIKLSDRDDLGYHFLDDRARRHEAIERWERWYEQEGRKLGEEKAQRPAGEPSPGEDEPKQ